MSLILRFSGSSNIVGMAIKLYTWSRYSHVETVVDHPTKGRMLFGALPFSGVGYRPTDATDGEFVEEYIVDTTPFLKHCYVEKLISQQGKPYDYTALAGILIHRDWGTNESSWFCSELIAWAMKESGIKFLRTEHKNRITPEELLLSPLLRRIT